MSAKCKSATCVNDAIPLSKYCQNCRDKQETLLARYPYSTQSQTPSTNDVTFRPELNVPGAKDDSAKVDMTLITDDMPRALMEIAKVSMFGMSKGYPRGGWLEVPDGVRRYKAAQFRHGLKPSMGEENDPESSLSHLAHEAWNAMAKLELYLRSTETQ